MLSVAHPSTMPFESHGGESFEIPGLNKTLEVKDLLESRKLYNILPTDDQQPEILDSHISNLASIFIRNRAEKIFGLHLAHGHCNIPENTVLAGVNYNKPYSRWARPVPLQGVDLSNVHGHVFVLTGHGFHPYECQAGPLPDLSGVGNIFLFEVAEYLVAHKLTGLLGLQIIDPNAIPMLELVLPQGSIMLDVSVLNGCTPTRQTGWKFLNEDGKPRVCTAYETHGRHAQGHDVYHKGDPHPRIERFDDVLEALAQIGVLA